MHRPTLIILATLTAFGCAELDRGDHQAEVDAADTPAVELDGSEDLAELESAVPPISFTDGTHDVLLDHCTSAGCHGSGAGGYPLVGDVEADYLATLDRVTPGDALASALIKKATNTSSHSGGPVLQVGTPEYDVVVAWIDGGAKP